MYPIGVILNSWPGANKNGPNPWEWGRGISRWNRTGHWKVSLVPFFFPHPFLSSQFFLPLLSCYPYFFFFLSYASGSRSSVPRLLVPPMQVMFAYTRKVENTRATVRVRNIFMDAAPRFPSIFFSFARRTILRLHLRHTKRDNLLKASLSACITKLILWNAL